MTATPATKAEEHTRASPFPISQLLSTHPRGRLFVHPLMWTAQHLGLLGCAFFDDGVVQDCLPPPPPSLGQCHPATHTPQEQPLTDILPAQEIQPVIQHSHPESPDPLLADDDAETLPTLLHELKQRREHDASSPEMQHRPFKAVRPFTSLRMAHGQVGEFPSRPTPLALASPRVPLQGKF